MKTIRRRLADIRLFKFGLSALGPSTDAIEPWDDVNLLIIKKKALLH